MKGYFDGNATTPVWDDVLSVYGQISREFWGNPSGLYKVGTQAKVELQRQREKIAHARGVLPERVVFTGGATEASNGILRFWIEQGQRGILSAVEHPSVGWVLKTKSDLIESWPVTPQGQISLEWMEARLQKGERPAWVALQSVNNETGVIQPVEALLSLLKPYSIKLLCDRSQECGKLPLPTADKRVWEVVTAHKFGGPKGVGWMILGDTEDLMHLLQGGEQEMGFRAGTEDLASIAGMTSAWEKIETWRTTQPHEGKARDQFEALVKQQIPDIQIVGESAPRVWNTSLLIMPRHENHRWVTRMNRKGFALATGAACSTGKLKGSDGLQAMGYSEEERRRVVRVSAGWWTALEEWRELGEALGETWRELEQESGASNVIVIPT